MARAKCTVILKLYVLFVAGAWLAGCLLFRFDELLVFIERFGGEGLAGARQSGCLLDRFPYFRVFSELFGDEGLVSRRVG